MMKFFSKERYSKNDHSSLQAEKRKLSLKLHPDKGGKNEDFIGMMREFETIENTINSGEIFENKNTMALEKSTSTSAPKHKKYPDAVYVPERDEPIDFIFGLFNFYPEHNIPWLYNKKNYTRAAFAMLFMGIFTAQRYEGVGIFMCNIAFVIAALGGRVGAYALMLMILPLGALSHTTTKSSINLANDLLGILVLWLMFFPVLGIIRAWLGPDEPAHKPDWDDLKKRAKKII